MRARTAAADDVPCLVVVGRPQRDVAPHVRCGCHRRSTTGGSRPLGRDTSGPGHLCDFGPWRPVPTTDTVLFGEIGARAGGGGEEITPPQNRAAAGRAMGRGVSPVHRGWDVLGADRYRHPAPRQGDSRATRRESPGPSDRPALSGETTHHARPPELSKREAAPGCATSRNPGAVAQSGPALEGASNRTRTVTTHRRAAPKHACRVRQRGCDAHGSSCVRVRPGRAPCLSQRAWALVSVTRARQVGEQALSAVRKVHHPKIVQRSDGRWLVVCQDCKRDGESATPDGHQQSRRLVRGGTAPLGGPL